MNEKAPELNFAMVLENLIPSPFWCALASISLLCGVQLKMSLFSNLSGCWMTSSSSSSWCRLASVVLLCGVQLKNVPLLNYELVLNDLVLLTVLVRPCFEFIPVWILVECPKDTHTVGWSLTAPHGPGV